jgi:choline transport protein
MSSLGWVASVASSVFVVTTMVEAMIEVTEPDFAFPNWQYTLIMLAFLFITIFFNTWGAPYLPLIETISLYGHLGGFLVVMIPLLVLCPKNSASDVFTSVVNSGGWSSKGMSSIFQTFLELGAAYFKTDHVIRHRLSRIPSHCPVLQSRLRQRRPHL